MFLRSPNLLVSFGIVFLLVKGRLIFKEDTLTPNPLHPQLVALRHFIQIESCRLAEMPH